MFLKSTSAILKLSLIIPFFLSSFSSAFSGETIQSFIQQGNENFNQSKYQEAIRYFREGVARKPENLPARLGLAGALYQQENFREAARELKSAIRLSPRNISLYLWLVDAISAGKNDDAAAEEFRQKFRPRLIELWLKNDYRQAIADYQSVLEQYPESAWADFLLGSIYLGLNRKEKAGQLYGEASRLAPGWDEPMARRNSPRLTGDLTAAVNQLKKFLRQHPESPPIDFTLGSLYKNLERSEEAVMAYEDFLASGIINRLLRGKTHINLSLIAVKNGDYRAALDQFNRSISLSSGSTSTLFSSWIFRAMKVQEVNPDQYRKKYQQNPGNWYLGLFVAELESREKNYDEAINIYKKALSDALRPQDRLNIFYWMISAAKSGGLVDQLIEEYQGRLKDDPQNCENYLFLSRLYSSRTRMDQAIIVLQAGLSQEPEARLLRARLASLYTKQGEYRKAIAEYQHLIDKNPIRPNYYGDFADCLFQKGEIDRGRELLNQICRRWPREEIAWTTAGRAYRKNGLFSDSAKAYSSALEIRPGDFTVSLRLARIYLKLRQYSRAGEVYRAAIARCDRPFWRGRLRKQLVKLYSNTGRLPELAREYENRLNYSSVPEK